MGSLIFPSDTNRIDEVELLKACFQLNESLAVEGDAAAMIVRAPFRLFAPATATSTFAPLTNTIVAGFVLRSLQSGEPSGGLLSISFDACRCFSSLSCVQRAIMHGGRHLVVLLLCLSPLLPQLHLLTRAKYVECTRVWFVCSTPGVLLHLLVLSRSLSIIVGGQVRTNSGSEVRRSSRSGKGSHMAELVKNEQRGGGEQERSVWS
jgi:hypothetical protein